MHMPSIRKRRFRALLKTAFISVPAFCFFGSAAASELKNLATYLQHPEFLLVSGMSDDGTVLVGTCTDGAAGDEACVWSADGGYIRIGSLEPAGWSRAVGISGDGRVVVGVSEALGFGYDAFRWTQEEGISDLGFVTDGEYHGRQATAANLDGSVIVGRTATATGTEAFRWTEETGMVALGALTPGSAFNEATAVSDDGRVVIGYGHVSTYLQAFRWTEETGMVGLGSLPGGVSTWATAVSGDGSVVVGQSYHGAETDTSYDPALVQPFRWTAATGMQTVVDWLNAADVQLAPGYVLSSATDVSADGTTIQGMVETPSGADYYFARADADRSGLIVLSDIQPQLAASVAGMSSTLDSIGLLIHGAHSQPVSRRVDAGQNTAWVAGDWGTNDHGTRDGQIGLAEVGFGHRFDDLQINVSLGQTWARQDLAQDGRADYETTFLTAEMLYGIQDDLWTTLGIYGAWGEADFKRGYASAGLTDHSKGSPDLTSWGLRARIDWLAAYRAGSIEVSPYLDLSHAQTKRDAYSESTGGFPASFDARTQKATELRLGASLNLPFGAGARVTATAEAVHRFQQSGPATRGTIDGLFHFSLPASGYDQDWLRLGLGVSGKLASGTASISVNASTQGEAPNAWLSASWQHAF